MTKPDAVRPGNALSPRLGPFADRERRVWIAGLCLLCGLLITLSAWAGRLQMNPDGISYLDMAHRLLQKDFSPLAHPYWSPLYPCLLALVLKVFPAPAMEFQAAHMANWLIGLSALASFTFFLTQRLASQTAAKGGESAASFRCRTSFGYMLFLWGTIEVIGLADINPDLCVAALVYLAAGLCHRLAAGRSRWYITSGILGVTLGLACLTKAAMAPLSVALLALLAIQWRVWRSIPLRRPSLAIAALGIIIVFGPYVFALSHHERRLTFGEAGRLNYAWLVQGGIPVHAGWMGQPPTAGTPSHPPRLLSSDPPVLEFKDTVPGTYPLWYDPAYFHKGLQVKFEFRKQITTIVKSLASLRWVFGSALYPLLAGLFVLACFASPRQAWNGLSRSLLLSWSLTAFVMFGLVTIQPRYVSGFMVLFWLSVYDAFSPGRLRPACQGAISVTAVCILLFQVHALLKTGADTTRTSSTSAHLAVARELTRLGLHAGDEIATEGSGFKAYYASLARLRIVANVGWTGGDGSGNEQLPALDDAKVNAIRDKFRQLRIKAIVSPENHAATAGNAWHSIGDTGYSVLLLDGPGSH
jgi:hypothetical protein